MSTCYLVRDINGKAAANTQLVVQFDGLQYSAQSGNDGIARFDVDIPAYARLITVGYATAIKVPCDQSGGGGGGTPGERKIQDVGTQCAIVERSASFGTNFILKHNSGRALTGGYEDLSKLRERISPANYPQCFAPLPPAAKSIVDELQDAIASISGGLADVVSAAGQEAASWRAAVDGIWARLESWLIEHILDIIWKALTVERKGD